MTRLSPFRQQLARRYLLPARHAGDNPIEHKILAQQGQALTEFLAIALAIIPLFLLIPVIGKYQDIAHSTQMASRYVAFEAMNRNAAMNTWKPVVQLTDNVRHRFYGKSDAPIKTENGVGNFAPNQNLFWLDPRGDPLIKDVGRDVTISFGPGDSTNQDDAFSAASDGKPFPGHELFDLGARGIYTARVTAALANLPSGLAFYEPFDRIDLTIARSTSVVIDPWMAGSPRQAESRVGGHELVFPSRPLRQASSIVDAFVGVIDMPGGVSGPRLGELDFWRDVAPEDRFK